MKKKKDSGTSGSAETATQTIKEQDIAGLTPLELFKKAFPNVPHFIIGPDAPIPQSINSELEVELNLSQKKPKSDAWKKGPMISKDEVTEGAKLGELRLKADGGFIPQKTDGPVDKVIKFGKHKGKTYYWLYKNDPSYMTWCFENIKGFADKAKAANYKEP